MLTADMMFKPKETTLNVMVFAWRCFVRALMIFVVFPGACAGFLLAFGSGWSFDGLAHAIVAPVNYVAQGSGIAVREHFCADAPNNKAVAPPTCKQSRERIVSVDQASSELASTLRAAYWMAVATGFAMFLMFGSVLPKWPRRTSSNTSTDREEVSATARM